jgi:acetyltransferase-like isoleucine patch superfamily enzyme
MKKYNNIHIQVGQSPEIDEDVIVGYPSGRLKMAGKVFIGNNAKIRSGSVIYQEVQIGDYFETGHHVVIREENQIGDHVQIWTNTVVDYGCRIGNRVKIHTGVYVAQFTVIEDDVFIAPGVIFANDKYPVSSNLEGPHIKKGARIGVNVTILPGIVVGEDALIGAGSVVTKNVPPNTVVAGNPAKMIKTADEVKMKKYLKER